MHVKQDISRCMSERIGDGGLDEAQLASALERAKEALATVRQWYAEDALPLLKLPGKTDDLDECHKAADLLAKGVTDVIILGTGGSSLGAQALAQLANYRVAGVIPFKRKEGSLRVHFLDNLDADTITQALADQPVDTTHFLAISKSGGTAETVMQLVIMLEALKKAGLGDNASEHIVVLTGTKNPEKNTLLQLARHHGIMVLEHDENIGGRYSVLSNVGVLPAIITGLDEKALRKGASYALDTILDDRAVSDVPAALGAALNVSFMEEKHITTTVMMPYCERLRLFAHWFQQLWAESIGKNGLGSTPVATVGPVDQHSLMQLFLDGPHDKLMNVIMKPTAGEGPRIPASYRSDPLMSYLAGYTVGDLTDCQQRATVETFARHNRPVRTFQIDGINETVMGELMMHFMLETILVGLMMGIDPFDQPAVEESKILARKYLKEMGRGA